MVTPWQIRQICRSYTTICEITLIIRMVIRNIREIRGL